MKFFITILLMLAMILVTHEATAFQFTNETNKTIVVRLYAEGEVCYTSPRAKAGSHVGVSEKPRKCVGKMYNVISQLKKQKTRYKCAVKDMPWDTNLIFTLNKSGKLECKKFDENDNNQAKKENKNSKGFFDWLF